MVTHTVAVTGATGFVGRHLLQRLGRREDLSVRALAHAVPDLDLPRAQRLKWVRGDLADGRCVADLLVRGGDLVHLAFPGQWSSEEHLTATQALINAAASIGVRRVIHCSTAVVAGSTPAPRVVEETPPRPAPGYESIKLALEQVWLDHAQGRFSLAVLRPTAVFGPGGRNLLKLSNSLAAGNRIVNYLRCSLFGRRRMNLVCVTNVVAAIEFLLDRPAGNADGIYIVSDDEDPRNNFRDVEASLRRAWGLPDYGIPPIPVPRLLLSVLLRAAGRSNFDPDRVYDASKLHAAGLKKPCDFERGLLEYASWYAATHFPSPRPRS